MSHPSQIVLAGPGRRPGHPPARPRGLGPRGSQKLVRIPNGGGPRLWDGPRAGRTADTERPVRLRRIQPPRKLAFLRTPNAKPCPSLKERGFSLHGTTDWFAPRSVLHAGQSSEPCRIGQAGDPECVRFRCRGFPSVPASTAIPDRMMASAAPSTLAGTNSPPPQP